MDITWFGHSCFQLKGKAVSVVTDPYSPQIGLSAPGLAADIVTVSHLHPGHSNISLVEGKPHIIDGPGEYEIGGVIILGTHTYHDNSGGKVRGKNTVYLIRIDGIDICHLGDLGEPLTSGQIEALGNVDVLLVPVGGVSTIDARKAVQMVRALGPKVVVPMHYQIPGLVMELEPVERFLREVGDHTEPGQPCLSLSQANLPPSTRVFLLTPNQG